MAVEELYAAVARVYAATLVYSEARPALASVEYHAEALGSMEELAKAERCWALCRDKAMQKWAKLPRNATTPLGVPTAWCLALPSSAVSTGKWLMAPLHFHPRTAIPVYVLLAASAGGFYVYGHWDDGAGVALCPTESLMAF
jgi:hypothetical protein